MPGASKTEPSPRDERFPRKPLNGCSGCNQDFASVAAFDRHRVGVHAYTYSEGLKLEPPVEDGRRCLDETELLEAGMEIDPRGRWRIAADAARAREAFSALRVAPERPCEDSEEERAA